MEFKNAQKIFDKSFRKAQRTHKKQSLHELEISAKQNPTDMWSRLNPLSPGVLDHGNYILAFCFFLGPLVAMLSPI